MESSRAHSVSRSNVRLHDAAAMFAANEVEDVTFGAMNTSVLSHSVCSCALRIHNAHRGFHICCAVNTPRKKICPACPISRTLFVVYMHGSEQ
jgi:hypothetical protein